MDRDFWNQRYADRDLVWGAGPNRFVVEEISGLPAGRALDLAAGECRNAIWLAEQGWRVVAVDFSDVALAKGQQLAARRGVQIDVREADLSRFVPDAGAYDLVLVAYLHVPWETMRVVLSNAAAAVAPGGTFLLVAHDLSNLTEGHGGPQDPAVLYTPGQVAAELDGLRVERAETVSRIVETPEGERVAIDHLVRASR